MRTLKKYIKELGNLFSYTFRFIQYLPYLVSPKKGKDTQKHKILVLANGPSLKDDLPFLKTQVNQADFIVLNFFALDPSFFVIKPKYYCFADPMFFGTTHNEEKVKELFKMLDNEVDWVLDIYISSQKKNKFISFANIKNKNIKILTFNEIPFKGISKLKYFLYKEYLACPQIQNVSILATYIAMNLGYPQIELYGVDYTFLRNIEVNEQNQLCNKFTYFYQKESSLKPIQKISNGRNYTVCEYLDSITLMFKGHEDLSLYEKYLKVNIYNCTKGSFIDVYKRK